MQFHTLEEKTIHVTRWRASGLTGQQYAEQNDIRYGSLLTHGERTYLIKIF